MANSDTHLTGGIMALIVMSLILDDDEQGPHDNDVDQGQEQEDDRKG